MIQAGVSSSDSALQDIVPVQIHEADSSTAVYQLRQAGLSQLVQLGETLNAWSEEIVAMWRFTRNNGITEGFHNKMELINRQVYGFRNFENYRLRVKVSCS